MPSLWFLKFKILYIGVIISVHIYGFVGDLRLDLHWWDFLSLCYLPCLISSNLLYFLPIYQENAFLFLTPWSFHCAFYKQRKSPVLKVLWVISRLYDSDAWFIFLDEVYIGTQGSLFSFEALFSHIKWP